MPAPLNSSHPEATCFRRRRTYAFPQEFNPPQNPHSLVIPSADSQREESAFIPPASPTVILSEGNHFEKMIFRSSKDLVLLISEDGNAYYFHPSAERSLP